MDKKYEERGVSSLCPKNSSKLEIEPIEFLPAGHELNWPTRRSLNRLGVGRFKYHLKKLGILQDNSTSYKCGVKRDITKLPKLTIFKEDILL